MNKGISKWPSKVLNLLVVLAMVISLCTILAPAALAQEYSIDVTIDSPEDQSTICISQNFVVSGVVTNDGDENLLGVTVRLDESIFVNGFATVIGGDPYPLAIGVLVAGQTATFEWVLHCDSGGEMQITAIGNSTSGGGVSDTDNVTVSQDPPCLVDVNTYYVDHGQLVLKLPNADGVANAYGTCSIFYINAAVSNPTSDTWTNVTTEITGVVPYLGASGCASNEYIEFANDSESAIKIIGNLNSKEVGDSWWKVHCCYAGEHDVTVTAYGNKTVNDRSVWGELCSKTITITQTGEVIVQYPDVEVIILEPTAEEASFCKGQVFVVKAQICNLTPYGMAQVNATIVYDPAVLQRIYPTGTNDDTIELGALEPNGQTSYCETVGWQMQCIGTGNTTIRVTGQASGFDPGQASVEVYQADSNAALTLNLQIDKETVCAGCQQVFTITANVCNLGCHAAAGVRATLSIASGDPNTVAILDDLGQNIGVLGGFGSEDACKSAVWHIQCLSGGNLTFQVDLGGGYDTVTTMPIVTPPETVDIRQVSLVTTIIDPVSNITNVCGYGNETVQGRVVSVGQQYYIEASVKNCAEIERTNVRATITLPPGVQLDDSQQVRVQRISALGTVLETYYRTNTEDIYIDKICECCTANVRWPVQCAWRSDDPTTVCREGQTVTVTAEDEGDTDSDSVIIVQQCKAHLMAGMVAFPGVFSDGTGIYLGDSSFQTTRALVVGKNQKFSLVVPVTNIGQSPASDVVVTVAYVGNATLTGGLTRTIGNIPGRSTRKAIFEFQCTAAGKVSFDIASLTGNDVNWNRAIEPSNINFACTLDIDQVEASWRIQIINPIENELIEVSTDFAVKAKIWNDGSAPLTGVTATLSWGTDANASNGFDAELLNTITQNRVQNISEILPGWYEIVWNMHCTAGSPGDGARLNIKVCAAAAGFADPVCDTTFVRQWLVPPPPPEPSIDVTILSPGMCTAVYTGEEYVVTATVRNDSPQGAPDATNVTVELYTSLGFILGDPVWDVGNLTAGQNGGIHSWRVLAYSSCEAKCNSSTDYITASGYIDDEHPADDVDTATVDIMPAARLVVENVTFFEMDGVTPIGGDAVNVCDEFIVRADVVNYGEADAWNVKATLSVFPEGSVRLAAGEAGYTQPVEGDLGNHLVGWGEDGEGTVEWVLHCKQACETTITITPSGMDECGWQPKDPDLLDGPCSGFAWVRLPGDIVQARNIVPASLTVKQLESGGLGGLDLAITKTADKSMALPGDSVEFTITVTNNGPTDASGVMVTDTWTNSGFDSMVVALATQGSVTINLSGEELTWNVGGLVVDASATLVLTAESDSNNKIVNEATVEADQPDGYVLNNTATVELNVSSMPITLGTGWNLISMPLIPQAGNFTVQLAGLNWAEVWAYDRCGGGWTFCYSDPSYPAPTLTRLVEGAGYWIRMTSPGTLTVTGVVMNTGVTLPPSFPVCVGWNLIGFKSTTVKTAGDYLEALRINGIRSWTMLYAFDNVGGYTRVLTNDNMVPGKGYWIAVTDAGTIYP
jgi:uncharacterized repeat protein (TIGR01451 family)